MLRLGGNLLIERLGLEAQPTETSKTPGLVRQKRPLEFALLTYVSQQDRAV
jgi:hypothetical protein